MSNWYENPKHLSIETLATLAYSKPSVFFHARLSLFEAAKSGNLDCINLVAEVCARNGYQPVLLESKNDWVDDLIAQKDHIHVFLGDTPRQGDNVFYCVPSYFHGFWYFDPVGSRNNSSNGYKTFDPATINQRDAEEFHKELYQTFVVKNFSKYKQPKSKTDQIFNHAIFVPCQTFEGSNDFKNYIDYPSLIKSTIAIRGERPVLIKPHPLQSDAELEQLAFFHEPKDNVFVVNDSIHALLTCSDIVITQSSAVAFESFLHKTPSVIAAETDFHHEMVVAKSVSEIAQGLSKAINKETKYEKYLYWFLKDQLVEPTEQHSARRKIRDVLNDAGYAFD